VQVDAWRSCNVGRSSRKELSGRLIEVRAPRFENATPHACQAVEAYLKSRRADATAFICLTDRLAVGALAACRDAGTRVPADVSIVSCGNTELARYARPAIDSIDVDYERHIALALELIDEALEDRRDPADCLRLVQPRLVGRDSVGRCRS
jgi:DNA-binding LacI/PurR family transcriptional regulator